MDLGDDRFDLVYDPQRISTDRMLEAVRELGYAPAIVEKPSTPVPEAAQAVDPARLTSELQYLLAEARRTEKPVLLDFTGPG